MARVTKKAAPWLTDEGLALVSGWARRGLTNDQMAEAMGIDRSTLLDWRKKYPPLSAAIKTNKDIADVAVENALYKRATGYDYTEETWYKDKDTGEMILSKKITKHVIPDTVAQIYWLKNRRPDLWRDRPAQVGNSAEDNLGAFFDALADAFADKTPPAPAGGDGDGT